MFTHKIPLFLLFILVSGCGFVPIESKVPDRLATFRARVTSGETSRHEVNQRLGTPFVHDEGLGIALHRVAFGRDADVHFAPLPVWVDTEDVIIYALVIYNRDGIVKAISWDVFERADSDYGFDDLPDNYRATSFRVAKLQALGYTFIAVKEGPGKSRKELLLAPASASHETMHLAPPANKCAVVFFYGRAAHPMSYLLDGRRIGEMPLVRFHDWIWDPDLQLVFARAVVSGGQHELKLDTTWKPRAFRREFDCTPGQVLYAHPELDLVKSEPWGLFGQKTRYEGEIRIDRQPLQGYKEWRRLLFFDGKWLGEN